MAGLIRNLNIGKRLLLGFAVVLLGALIAIGIGITRLQAVAHASEELLDEPLATERMVSDWYTLVYSGIERNLAIGRSQDATLVTFFAGAIKNSTEKSAALQKQIEPHIDSPREKALWDEAMAVRKTYLEERAKLLVAKKAEDTALVNDLIEKKFSPVAALYSEKIRAILTEEREQINKTSAEVQEIYQSSRNLMIGLGVVLTLFVVVSASLLSNSITAPLERAVAVARKVAAGDLTADFVVESRDETGQLLEALREMNHKLSSLVLGVRGSTETISVASHQIAAGNADLSNRTENQASSLEETASSMEELTGTVRQNADNAHKANELVISASGVAVRGGAVVSQVVTTMNGIKDSSRRIADIIGVIDGIAFQTNILALNAAVEAARAGEQGRGFAVVASEVRNLAQRSAGAAKEIKSLIDDSVHQVDQGSKLVDEAGHTMSELVGSVKRVADIMHEITSASREQSDGIEQVNIAITQMDQMTQQNAALVEQAAAAAESMQQQAAALTQAVSIFKLGAAAIGQAPVAARTRKSLRLA